MMGPRTLRHFSAMPSSDERKKPTVAKRDTALPRFPLWLEPGFCRANTAAITCQERSGVPDAECVVGGGALDVFGACLTTMPKFGEQGSA